jgi:type II secretory pathway pseudopilin PulG
MNQKGFTSKELVMAVAVIGILCLAAIPQFFAMQNLRRDHKIKKTIETTAPITHDSKPSDSKI